MNGVAFVAEGVRQERQEDSNDTRGGEWKIGGMIRHRTPIGMFLYDFTVCPLECSCVAPVFTAS